MDALMCCSTSMSPVATRYRREVCGWTHLVQAVCAGRFLVARGSVVCVGALKRYSILPPQAPRGPDSDGIHAQNLTNGPRADSICFVEVFSLNMVTLPRETAILLSYDSHNLDLRRTRHTTRTGTWPRKRGHQVLHTSGTAQILCGGIARHPRQSTCEPYCRAASPHVGWCASVRACVCL